MRVSVILDLFQPIFDVDEGVSPKLTLSLPGNVIDQKCTNSASVVGTRNRPEILLASSVPDLEFDIFVIDRNSLGSEFNSNSHVMGHSCLILDELKYDT